MGPLGLGANPRVGCPRQLEAALVRRWLPWHPKGYHQLWSTLGSGVGQKTLPVSLEDLEYSREKALQGRPPPWPP